MKLLLILMVAAGAATLIASMINSCKLHKIVPASLKNKWLFLTILICFFIIGYIGYIIIQILNINFQLDILVSCIFFAGSLFVYGVISLANFTLSNLKKLNDNLENEVTKRTFQLNSLNKSLSESEIELNKQNQFLESVLDALTHPLYVINVKDFEIVLANKYSGIDLSKPNRTCHWLTHKLVHPCQGVEHPCPIVMVKEENRPVVVNHVHYNLSGEERIVEIHCYPIYDESNDISQVIEYTIDITDKKKVEKEMIKAQQIAESASKAKSLFLANMSHEIRTPMNAIMGMSHLALQTDLDHKQRRYIENVYSSAEHLLRIIGDVLDFSKIEAGQLTLNMSIFNLHHLLEDVVTTLNANAIEKGLSLQVTVDDKLPTSFIGDDMRLRQILLNLIGNAIKFTPSGLVAINVILESEIEAKLDISLHFIVKDTGIGIPPEKLDLIFNSFEQADTSVTRQYGGSGLGLAICNQLVTMMKGRMWVDSQVNSGSSFHFIVELQPNKETIPIIGLAQASSLANKNSSLRILLVDDNEINRDVASMMLEHEHHFVTTSQNGLEALSALEHDDFDLIFMDMQMPEMDGVTATTIIRTLEKGAQVPERFTVHVSKALSARLVGRHIPIIAMTANVMEEDQERCSAAGMDSYLLKPFLHHQLLSILQPYIIPPAIN